MHPFTVVADPVRRRIVEVLVGGERTAGEVVEIVGGEFGISQSAVSQQLKVLRVHGFARARPEGARRIYALEPTAVGAMDAWLRAVSVFWADRLDDLAVEVEGRSNSLGTARVAARGAARTLGRIVSVTRTVRDLAESEAFYGDVVGLSHLVTAGATVAFDAGGARLLLVAHGHAGRFEVWWVQVRVYCFRRMARVGFARSLLAGAAESRPSQGDVL